MPASTALGSPRFRHTGPCPCGDGAGPRRRKTLRGWGRALVRKAKRAGRQSARRDLADRVASSV